MNPEFDDVALVSEYYSGNEMHHAQFPPEPGTTTAKQPRRRRRKSEEGSMRKRKLSEEQVSILEQSFCSDQKLETERKDRLAAELGLESRQVAVWFQNRRTRWKNKKIEEGYSKLKADHESTVVQKCRLETEILLKDSRILKLEEHLDEARRTIQRLSERTSDRVSSNSPSSSFSTDPPQFLNNMEAFGNAFDYGLRLTWDDNNSTENNYYYYYHM